MTGRAPPAPPVVEHPNLGPLTFEADTSTWESTADMEVCFAGIPDHHGHPAPESCRELMHRMQSISRYWQACDEQLRSLLQAMRISGEPCDVMRVAAVTLSDDGWELCFETLPRHRWLYVGMQFRGEELVSSSIDE